MTQPGLRWVKLTYSRSQSLQEAESKFKPRPQSYVRASTLNFCCCQKQRFMLKKHSQVHVGCINYQWKKEVVEGAVESFSEVQMNHEFLFESFPILYVLYKHLHYNELCKKWGGGTERGELVSSAVAWETAREHPPPIRGRLCRQHRDWQDVSPRLPTTFSLKLVYLPLLLLNT